MTFNDSSKRVVLLQPEFDGPYGKGGSHWLYYYNFGIGDAADKKLEPIEGVFGLVVCSQEYFDQPDPTEPVDTTDNPLVIQEFSEEYVRSYVEQKINEINSKKFAEWSLIIPELKKYFYLDD
jgi:hypothetical protein